MPAPQQCQNVQEEGEFLGDPVADEKMLYEVSPAFHGAKIKKPLIVLLVDPLDVC